MQLRLIICATPGPIADVPAFAACVTQSITPGQPVHAIGSAWVFLAPAYTPGIVVQTDLLCGFPTEIQGAINHADIGERLLVAVEAGIKVRDLSLALMGRDHGAVPERTINTIATGGNLAALLLRRIGGLGSSDGRVLR